MLVIVDFARPRESEESVNRGNFLEFLELVATRDDIQGKRVEFGPQNAKYTHHTVQNALLIIMANLVLNEITAEVERSKYFGIICDETRFVKKEQKYLL